MAVHGLLNSGDGEGQEGSTCWQQGKAVHTGAMTRLGDCRATAHLLYTREIPRKAEWLPETAQGITLNTIFLLKDRRKILEVGVSY